MLSPDQRFSDLVRSHGRMFVAFVVIGAFAALGIRSTFQDVGGVRAAPTMPTPGPHAGPGHEGHAHAGAAKAGSAAPSSTEPATNQKKPGGKHDGHGKGAVPETDAEATPAGAGSGVLLDLGNAKCPVMGGDPDGETFSEWNGLRVAHCCPMCGERFLKNPESLLDEVSPDWRNAAKAAQAIDAADDSRRAELLAEAGKSWRVLREPVSKALAPAPKGLLIDLGNADCPVMGGAVSGETFTEWKGLRVGHCCPGCGKRFLKDPETLLDEVSKDWRDALAAVRSVNEAKGAARTKALEAVRIAWRVIREPVESE